MTFCGRGSFRFYSLNSWSLRLVMYCYMGLNVIHVYCTVSSSDRDILHVSAPQVQSLNVLTFESWFIPPQPLTGVRSSRLNLEFVRYFLSRDQVQGVTGTRTVPAGRNAAKQKTRLSVWSLRHSVRHLQEIICPLNKSNLSEWRIYIYIYVFFVYKL